MRDGGLAETCCSKTLFLWLAPLRTREASGHRVLVWLTPTDVTLMDGDEAILEVFQNYFGLKNFVRG